MAKQATLIPNDARFSRQAQIIHPDLASAQVLVAGLGMMGSWTVMALARCVAHVHAFDPDVVEDVNSGNQAYHGGVLGQPKGTALESLLVGLPVTTEHAPFDLGKAPEEMLPYPREGRKLIVFSGADSFKVRADVANYARHHKADLFIDTRAMGDVCVVQCIVPPHQVERYLRDEVYDDASVPDQPCGMNGTAYVGMYTAARLVASLNTYFRTGRAPFIRVENLGVPNSGGADALRLEESDGEEEVVHEEVGVR